MTLLELVFDGWLNPWLIGVYVLVLALAGLAIRDRKFGTTPIVRNFPVVGHLRYFLIEIGPELRQYLVASNREEKPFNRNEREWIYRSSEGANNFFGFGSDDEQHATGYWVIKQSQFPYGEVSFADKGKELDSHNLPCAKVMGKWHARARPYRPKSIINVSAMSFGALSGNAIASLNMGCKLAGACHNTGEGGVSRHHRHGADIIYQIGTGMFGCRDERGAFSPEKLMKLVKDVPTIRAIEIKLSQGAKPGKGGVLPGAKVTEEISEARGVPVGHDCISPNKHAEFATVGEMIDFIERVTQFTGLPVGIKSAVGQMDFWHELADRMAKDPMRGPDFITIDGGEGGTGAAPLTFSDHVSLPLKIGFPRVYKIFHEKGVAEHVVWIASGKLGFPDRAAFAMAMGADMVNIAREAMLAIGCIQAQKCHTNRCPAGVATQSKYLQSSVRPERDAVRLAKYIEAFRKELLAVTHAVGYSHPSQITAEDVEVSSGTYRFLPLSEIIGYNPKRIVVTDTGEFQPKIMREAAASGSHARTIRVDKETMTKRMNELKEAGSLN